MENRHYNIIGAGVAGMTAAATLAREGNQVSLFDKNAKPGGRASLMRVDGYTFDMGPSWYWMPQVFEDFFKSMGTSVSEEYDLVRLDPAYKVFFGSDDCVEIPANWERLKELFESIEAGASEQLEKYMSEAAYKYKVGMEEFVWKPGKSVMEFAQLKVVKSLFRLDMFTSVKKHVSKYFTDPRLRQIMEFPVLFLGAAPSDTPALYSLMNYADLKLGTWYPKGGMYEISRAMARVAKDAGVEFHFNSAVSSINTKGNKTTGLTLASGESIASDGVIAAADYHHVDQNLLPESFRQYNLFFDEDFNEHARLIYKTKDWPSSPLFYACCPSKTDESVAPDGKENLFLLVPLPSDLEDNDEKREKLFEFMMNKLKKYTGFDVGKNIEVKRSFAMRDFKTAYNSFKGNAYGLANTLDQTAILKPSMHHKKLKNLLFAGQLTTPGPG
ncbi:MAG: phytoene desaturase, partial [Bacteroidetes bacterium]|nr:phytoene desaturase [Bacteroidota bacterium]